MNDFTNWEKQLDASSEFPSRKDILDVYKLDYETTADIVGHLSGNYARFMMAALAILGSAFGSGILLKKQADILFVIIPYLSMLTLAMENYARTNLWFNYRYLLLLQERINKFIGRQVFLYGSYFRPMLVFQGFGIWLINVYRAFIPFLFFVGINIYSVSHVQKRSYYIFNNEFLERSYAVITYGLLIITTFVWIYFLITMVSRYDKIMRKRLSQLEQQNYVSV